LLTSNIKRKVSFVSAAKSMRRNIIGPMLKASEAIPVERPQDVAWKGPGHIESAEGNRVYGNGTRFTEIKPKSSLAIKTQEFFVKEIISDEEIITGTTDYKEIEPNSPYKVIPKL
jgi:glycerol-3-phosphate O-acyltransferase/dihydroxyacetone phosphate acyltransferase